MRVGYKTILRVQTVSTEHVMGKDIIINVLGWEKCEDKNRTTWNITHLYVHKPLHKIVKFLLKFFSGRHPQLLDILCLLTPFKCWVFIRPKLSLYCKSSLHLLYFFSENSWGFWDHFFSTGILPQYMYYIMDFSLRLCFQ